jgi:diguanylate cyclase (GGDEF)-like protein
MLADREHRRVMVVADSPEAPLVRLFTSAPLAAWEAVPVDGLGAADFALQHHACDLLLLDEPIYRRDGVDGFHWLARRHQLPTVVLIGTTAAVAQAGAHGVEVWLPREPALKDPGLLALALEQASRCGELQRVVGRLDESVRQSRRQVDRLVGLLWRTLPLDADRRWFTQRHMLERLREEVSRTHRHGNQLTVALGQVQTDEGALEESGATLADWTADRVTRGKRRCDVAGQYGLRGFMLLLVNTPARGAVVCCRRLQTALEKESGATGPQGPVQAYFGLASLPAGEATPEALLRAAEERLDAARENHRERLVSG